MRLACVAPDVAAEHPAVLRVGGAVEHDGGGAVGREVRHSGYLRVCQKQKKADKQE